MSSLEMYIWFSIISLQRWN